MFFAIIVYNEYIIFYYYYIYIFIYVFLLHVVSTIFASDLPVDDVIHQICQELAKMTWIAQILVSYFNISTTVPNVNAHHVHVFNLQSPI